jgi:1,4-dihydroxy-2-naphthoate octaprenyltransferase
MREVSEVLGEHSSLAWFGFFAFIMTKIVESVNEIVSTFTGVAALILLVLTIIGKYNEIKSVASNKRNGKSPH